MRRLLAILIILTALMPARSQAPIRFSVHLDPQFAWFSSDDKGAAGLQMDYFFAENYAFALGVAINNLGGNLLYTDSTEFSIKGEPVQVVPGNSVKQNLQYVDIPVGLKLKTEELGYATFFFQLGFNPMININAKGTSDAASMDKDDIRENIHLFCLGYHAGAGVEYKLGGNTAVIGGIRWTSGLTDVTDNDRANVKLNALSVHLGILF
jgi:hypothetical protein